MARGLLGVLEPSGNHLELLFLVMKPEDTAKCRPHPCGHNRNGNKVGKRSFRRAQHRAFREGRTLYRGRWYTAAQICYPNQVFTSTTKRQKPLLCPKKPGEERRAGRYNVFSWNAGGLSTGQMDELFAWVDSQDYDIVFVQETRWRHESSWETSSYFCMHCGENKKGNSWCGLLVLISKKVTTPALIRWASVLPGRIMHVRLQDRFGTVDLINCYQVPFSGHVEKQRCREEVWRSTSTTSPSTPDPQSVLTCRRLQHVSCEACTMDWPCHSIS